MLLVEAIRRTRRSENQHPARRVFFWAGVLIGIIGMSLLQFLMRMLATT